MEKKETLARDLCNMACTKVIKFMTDHTLPAGIGVSLPPYTSVDGYRYINIYVRFSQVAADEPPVDLGVMFAFDSHGTMGSRRYVNLEENLGVPQKPTIVGVSGEGCWHGSQENASSYLARFPIMGPYVEVIVYNQAAVDRTVSVWGYLVS